MIPLRNPIVYPAGVAPGFNISHRASAGIRISAVATTGGNFINLLTGQLGTKTGSATTVQTPSGPAVNFGTAMCSSWPTFGPAMTQITEAVVVTLTASQTVAGVVGLDAGNTGQYDGIRIPSLSPVFYYSSSNYNSGVTLSLNVPYIIVASVKANSVNFMIANLATGQAWVNASTNGAPASISRIPVAFYVNNTVYASSAKISAVMISATYLSLADLAAWAADPWLFWYPEDYMDANFVGSSQVIAAILGAASSTGVGYISPSAIAAILGAASNISAASLSSSILRPLLGTASARYAANMSPRLASLIHGVIAAASAGAITVAQAEGIVSALTNGGQSLGPMFSRLRGTDPAPSRTRAFTTDRIRSLDPRS